MVNASSSIKPVQMDEQIKTSILKTESLTIRYGTLPAVKNVSLAISEKQITALIGPSGCGKSTLLRSFNRMNDFIPSMSYEGRVLFRGQDLYATDIDPVEVRRQDRYGLPETQPVSTLDLQKYRLGSGHQRLQGGPAGTGRAKPAKSCAVG